MCESNNVYNLQPGDLVEVLSKTRMPDERILNLYLERVCKVREVMNNGAISVYDPDGSGKYAYFNPSDLRPVDRPMWRVEKPTDSIRYCYITDGEGNYLDWVGTPTVSKVPLKGSEWITNAICAYANAHGPHPPAKPKPWTGTLGKWDAKWADADTLTVDCKKYPLYKVRDWERDVNAVLRLTEGDPSIKMDDGSFLPASTVRDFIAEALVNRLKGVTT